MVSTIIRDSVVGDDWIRQMQAGNPIKRIIDEKTGLPTDNFVTGPVRISYPNLDKLPEPTKDIPNPKYSLQALFPPNTDFTPLYEEYYKQCAAQFPEYLDAASGQYYGLHSPWRDQAEKVKNGGYTPGCQFMTFTSQFKPPVVDPRYNPIVDIANKAYAGSWAICIVNTYAYGKNPVRPKKGIAFGLQMVMLIADDTKFGNAAPDPRKTFASAGVNVTAPIVRPNMSGAPMAQPPAPGAPAVPQSHYVPGQGHVPGAPTAHVPPVPVNDDPDEDPSMYS